MTDRPLTERLSWWPTTPTGRTLDASTQSYFREAADELARLQERLAEAERRYAELVKDTKQAIDDAGWAEELAEAKLAEAERERDEALGRESHHATKRKQAESQLAEAKAALEDLLVRYLSLAESGDCGFWDAQSEPQVVKARDALAAMDKEGT